MKKIINIHIRVGYIIIIMYYLNVAFIPNKFKINDDIMTYMFLYVLLFFYVFYWIKFIKKVSK